MPLDRRSLLAAAIGASALAHTAKAQAVQAAQASAADPLGVRGDFPITSAKGIFLNTAYSAPVPRPVIAAAQEAAERKAMNPINAGAEYTQQVRDRFARLVNAEPDEIALIRSTGEGENLVAWGLGLKPGDNVVMSSLHYDSEFILYRVIEKELGVQFRIVPHKDGVVGVKEMEPFVDKRTRLITVALVSHQNGFVHDLKALADLAHANGAYLFADAVQAAGAVPIDVKASGVDFLCANSYKWLLSTGSVSGFYVRRGLFGRLHLDRYGEGQISRRLPNRQYEFYDDARRFEFTSIGDVSAAQFAASLAYIDRIGLPRIEAHGVGLGLKLQRELGGLGRRLYTPPGNRSPIVAYYINTPPPQARETFAKAGINVTARDGTVRVSAALFNTEAEIDRFLDVAQTIA
jgi:selenocysteine lyase/cysteine desulfurase